MDKIDFNSDEWKEKLKGKSPEEIAKIVGDYYEEKYKDITELDKKRLIGWIIFLLIVILGVIFVFSYLKSLSRGI
ncbi:hypothetical protein J7K25_02305 [bacterium]|nr:hypothetical protein [bacterium]